MKDLFTQLYGINAYGENRVLTRLSGDEICEQALVADGKLIWESIPDGFFSAHKAETEALTENGVSSIGDVSIYTEIIGREKKLVVCGGGHVSMPIIAIGKMIGFHVICLEDRPMFADNARRAGADEVLCNAFDKSLESIPGDGDTFFVIVTRGHKFDEVCLRSIAKKRHAYIGLMGSRRRVRMVMDRLVEDGYDKEVLDNVFTPIGLNIGGETPEEIAVSVMAEIIQVKNKLNKRYGYSHDIVGAVLGRDGEPGKKGVLATIVTRRGSAPRDVGTKMMVLEDGTTIDTIGGGCIEADVITKARALLLDPDAKSQLIRVNMTADEAEDEGMVCGGVVDVLMHVIR